MNSAKRMFELINYELNRENKLELVYAHKTYPYFIHFDKTRKNVCKYGKRIAFGIYEYTVIPESIKLSELEAINKQIEEFGWIK